MSTRGSKMSRRLLRSLKQEEGNSYPRRIRNRGHAHPQTSYNSLWTTREAPYKEDTLLNRA